MASGAASGSSPSSGADPAAIARAVLQTPEIATALTGSGGVDMTALGTLIGALIKQTCGPSAGPKERQKQLQVPKLTVDKDGKSNYTIWTVRFRNIMLQQGYWTPFSTDPPTAGTPERQKYDSDNEVAWVTLLSAMPDKYIPMLQKFEGVPDSARKGWQALDTQFVLRTAWSECDLRRDFWSLEIQKSESIDEYIMRAEVLWIDFERMNIPLTEREWLTKIVDGVPVSWRRSITTSKPSPADWDKDFVFSVLREDEQIRTRNNKGKGASGLAATSEQAKPQSDKTQANQAKGGKGKGSGGGNNKEPPTCWYCKKKGHRYDRCYQKPTGWQPPFYNNNKGNGPQDSKPGPAGRANMSTSTEGWTL